MTLALPAHAKLNLELRVLGARPDGQHEVDTLIQAISLHDLLLASAAPATTLELDGEAPAGEANLVLKAARALEELAGRPLPVRLRLLKRIPPGAGLGGGSSDAAAALRALARLYGLELDLAPVAAALGADVSFFLRGGAARAGGRGEELHPARPQPGWYALAWPGYQVSTADVYRAWDETGGEPPNELLRAAITVEPRLAAFTEALGTGWRMTGSGSAFFKPAATEAEARSAVAGLECWTEVAWA